MYRSLDHKAADARAYKRDEQIPWPVLVDGVDGHIHDLYGRMPDPTYLIDADGIVAFYQMVTHAPTLSTAIDEFVTRARGGDAVRRGTDRIPHMFAALVAGWPALQRGGVRALLDLAVAVPGSAPVIYLGHLARPVFAPVALRSTPLPTTTRMAFGTMALALVALAADRRRTRASRRAAQR